MQMISINSFMAPDPSAMATMREKMFAKADADGDGKLTLSEFKVATGEGNQAKAVGLDGVDGAKAAKGPPPPGGKPIMDIESLFSSMDADGDGVVSAKEHAAFQPQMGQDTINALLSLQGLNQNAQPAISFEDDGSMSDIINQLQTILDKFKERENSSAQRSVTA
jgi:hypothetical protein